MPFAFSGPYTVCDLKFYIGARNPIPRPGGGSDLTLYRAPDAKRGGALAQSADSALASSPPPPALGPRAAPAGLLPALATPSGGGGRNGKIGETFGSAQWYFLATGPR